MTLSARLIALSLSLLSLSGPVFSAPPAKPAPVQTQKPVPPPPVESKSDGELWDAWYTITIRGTIRYAFYNEKAERKGGKISFRTQMTKQEEGYLNDEQVGAFAEDNPQLTPLFFNFHSSYRSTETIIDGTFKDGKQVTVKVRKGSTDFPLVKRSVPAGTFVAILFPLWLQRNVARLEPGKSVSFHSILEDNIEASFAPIPGRVTVEKPDALAARSQTTKLSVNYNNLQSTWWIERSGIVRHMEVPATRMTVDRVSQEQAQKFLDE